jgi:hypothetical protein
VAIIGHLVKGPPRDSYGRVADDLRISITGDPFVKPSKSMS